MSESVSLPIATSKKRIAAFVIDDLMVAFLLFVIFYDQLMVITSHLPSVLTPEAIEAFKHEIRQFSVNNLLLIVTLKILYHAIPVWQNGTTLGKYIMKIKVIDFKIGTTPSLYQAFLRALLRILSEAFFYLGFALAFMMPLRQTLHDKLSNCVVIDV